MEQRPRENPVLAAKGHMQRMWFKPKLKQQEIVNKERLMLKAQGAVED